ncbi:NADH-cytochrome b5 reductase-like [Toxorhynchites rutilus septentrionalis]|uniref:NADH-cytochrome b5 reductase-like n=1 Tax=Toxorhynchites rutilus septentrionalis TaxID=329112 RepID=UPI00247949A3|nr:NADH-cytochrome b5 reductase-like [Toxorhynchites rutilus septentrionalis]
MCIKCGQNITHSMESDDNVPECCGSGCTNCVLDRTPSFRRPNSSSGKAHIFDGGYKLFECTDIKPCGDNTFMFRFQIPTNMPEEADKLLMIPPGSHLVMRAARNWRETNRSTNRVFTKWLDGVRQRLAQRMARERKQFKGLEKYDKSEQDLYFSRPYTPVKVVPDGRFFEVLIKLEVCGQMSEFLTTLNVGDLTEWKGVYSQLIWERNKFRSLIGFAQGVGLAPIYSIMASILADDTDETRLFLCYCCKDVDNILLRSNLLEFGGYWNFECVIYLSREACTCGGKTNRQCSCLSSRKKYNERVFNHRLEKMDIENLLFKYTRDSHQVLICGNESFSSFVETTLTELTISSVYKFQ